MLRAPHGFPQPARSILQDALEEEGQHLPPVRRLEGILPSALYRWRAGEGKATFGVLLRCLTNAADQAERRSIVESHMALKPAGLRQ